MQRIDSDAIVCFVVWFLQKCVFCIMIIAMKEYEVEVLPKEANLFATTRSRKLINVLKITKRKENGEMTENMVTSISLAYIVLLVGGLIWKYCSLDRIGKLNYIKSFKKGKFASLYFAAIPLYWIGVSYNGVKGVYAFLEAIKSTVELVVLKYGYSNVSKLLEDNTYYRAVMYLCYVLVTLNAIAFVLAITGERIYNSVKKFSIIKSRAPIYIVVGWNEKNKMIIKSLKGRKNAVILTENLTTEALDFAYEQKIAIAKEPEDGSLSAFLEKNYAKFTDRAVNVIVNTGDDAKNLIYVEQISNLILEGNLFEYSVDDIKGLNCYVFGEPENESAFLHYVKKTNGCVRFIDKYKLIAMDFMEKYPLTEFMSKKELDYENVSIKEKVELNVVMVGFGKTNRRIFLTSVANNQFLVKKGNEYKEKIVNYYIYDKNEAKENKSLNHDYFRYCNLYDELLLRQDEFLPIPPKPANETFIKKDVNSGEFYKSVRENLSNGGENAFNYLIIAYGSDMENLDFAEKLSEKLREWGLSNQTKLFVKIRDGVFSKNIVDKEYAPNGGYMSFGNEAETVYNIDKIIHERNETMAKDRHICYALEYCDPANEKEAIKKANNEWYSVMQQTQREANVYACLSIKPKLQLLGYDLAKDGNDDSDEFMREYTRFDPIKYTDKEIKGKRVILYDDCDFKENTVRNAYARQEHQRWNAYEICSGVIPASIAEIKTKSKEQLIKVRKHRNITTYDGLLEYRKIMAKQTGKTESDCDVIKYDYQLMDDIVWLVKRHGYNITKRK